MRSRLLAIRAALIGLAVSFCGGVAAAQNLTQWTSSSGGNDHYYQVYSTAGNVTWTGAQQAASSMGGYLATINSSAENTFVFGLGNSSAFWSNDALNSRGPWLGGFQLAGSVEPGGGWQWLNGEGNFTYTSWHPPVPVLDPLGEPNNNNGGESYLELFGTNLNNRQAFWNDAANNAPARSFVVEFNTTPTTTALPQDIKGSVSQWAVGDGGNGHYYQPVESVLGITWTDAAAAAAAAGGYLSTIGSATENTFVFNLINSPEFWLNDPLNSVGPWLGGFQPSGSGEPGNGWQWVNGDGNFTYSNWTPGEPNNNGGDESSLVYFSTGLNTRGKLWNDMAPMNMPYGYVIEFDFQPIPEPATAAAIGGLLAIACGWHRRRASATTSRV